MPLAYFFNTNEALDKSKFIGLIIGFLGIVILFSPDFTLGNDTSILITLGKLACILAAFCYASNSILMRKLPSIDPVGLAAISLLIGTVWVVLWAIAIEGPPPNISTETLLILTSTWITTHSHGEFHKGSIDTRSGSSFSGHNKLYCTTLGSYGWSISFERNFTYRILLCRNDYNSGHLYKSNEIIGCII